MMIDAEYIRTLRPVAKNIDPARIDIYIDEAERLDVLPTIGAELYERLTETSENELTDEERMLLNGGYYDSCDGERRRFEGLRKALGYLAYARFVFNHPAQVTPTGVVVKSGDESAPADTRMVASMAAEARKAGREHLATAVLYWADVRRSRSVVANAVRETRRRFVKIGR